MGGLGFNSAMVLAAGLGTRMRPVTNAVPKPLVRLAGRPLLDHVLDRLADAGIARAVVNVHYFADQIESHLATRRTPQIMISDERDLLLDTGGGVTKALPLLGAEPFLVHNSDSVWAENGFSNIGMMLKLWKAGAMSALLLLADRDSSIGYDGKGDFNLDASARLSRRKAGEAAPYVFAGVSILDPELFEDVPAPAFSLNVIFDKAAQRDRLFGCVLDGTWMHVGTPGALIQAEERLHEIARRTA